MKTHNIYDNYVTKRHINQSAISIIPLQTVTVIVDINH